MDYSVTAMWVICVYAYWRGVKEKKWMIFASIFLGMALATKINALFIYMSLLFFWIISPEKKKLLIKSIPVFVIPPVLFFASWPWLWKDPIARFWEYFNFHMQHVFLRTYYMGKVYLNVPWQYTLTMVSLTIPLIILIFAVFGLFCVFRKSFRRERIWILFNALFPIIIFSFPKTPRYDGIRLFMASFPFICIIFGMGLEFFNRFKMKYVLWCVFIPLFILSIYNGVIKYHPYQIAYYNELMGGIEGAEIKGMERDYWGGCYEDILDWLNKQGDIRIFVYEYPYAFLWYKIDGMLNHGVILDSYHRSKYMVLLIRQGFFNKETWEYYNNKKPVCSVELFGVPLVCVYEVDEKI